MSRFWKRWLGDQYESIVEEHAEGDWTEAGTNDAEKEARGQALMPFVVISLSYMLYTFTDGSVRMIVLLAAYNMGFTALEVAVMFTLYETAGVLTNLLAGIAGAKWGIKCTLLWGLGLQICGLGMLCGWQSDAWDKVTSVAYVTFAQMLCGIAKDLVKLGGKTVTKLVTPEEKQGCVECVLVCMAREMSGNVVTSACAPQSMSGAHHRVFRCLCAPRHVLSRGGTYVAGMVHLCSMLFSLVSYITGFKNSLKGVGYLVGAAIVGVCAQFHLLLFLGIVEEVLGFEGQERSCNVNGQSREVVILRSSHMAASSADSGYLYAMSLNIFCILLAFPCAIVCLSDSLGTAKSKNISIGQVLFNGNHNLNWLSLARLLLFGSRDLWFEVRLLHLQEGGAGGYGGARGVGTGYSGGTGGAYGSSLRGAGGGAGSGGDGGNHSGDNGGDGGVGVDRTEDFIFAENYGTNYGYLEGGTTWFGGGGGGSGESQSGTSGIGERGGSDANNTTGISENGLWGGGSGGTALLTANTDYDGDGTHDLRIGDGGSGIVIIRSKTTSEIGTVVEQQTQPSGIMKYDNTGSGSWSLSKVLPSDLQDSDQHSIISQLLTKITELGARIEALEASGGTGSGGGIIGNQIAASGYSYDYLIWLDVGSPPLLPPKPAVPCHPSPLPRRRRLS